MARHTGELPFRCPECDAAFPSQQRVKEHVKGKHPHNAGQHNQTYLKGSASSNKAKVLLPSAMRPLAPARPIAQPQQQFIAHGPNGAVYLITNPPPQQPPPMFINSHGQLIQLPQQQQQPQIIINAPPPPPPIQPQQPIFIQPPLSSPYNGSTTPASSVMSSLLSPREASMLTIATPEVPTPEPSKEPLLDIPRVVTEQPVYRDMPTFETPEPISTITSEPQTDNQMTSSDPKTPSNDQEEGVRMGEGDNKISFAMSNDKLTFYSDEDKAVVKVDILSRAILDEIPDLIENEREICPNQEQSSSSTTPSHLSSSSIVQEEGVGQIDLLAPDNNVQNVEETSKNDSQDDKNMSSNEEIRPNSSQSESSSEENAIGNANIESLDEEKWQKFISK